MNIESACNAGTTMTNSIPSTTQSQWIRRKVKTGCKTCKARKIKCDEGRPSCQRCINGGRACGGYGIWGGGARPDEISPDHATASKASSTKASDLPDTASLVRSPRLVLVEGATPLDGEYFEWFKLKTSTKLTGAFVSDFWTRVIFQATTDEPAVMHAVLALSSVQMTDMYEGYSLQQDSNTPNERERYALGHYTKAIKYVRQNAFADIRGKTRLALITCILFASLELFRCRYKSARMHLEGGMTIFKESRAAATPTTQSQSIDDDDAPIIEALCRLHALTNLFNRNAQQIPAVLCLYEPLPKHTFRSLEHARRHLDNFFLSIRDLSIVAERTFPNHSPKLCTQQTQLRDFLSEWLLLLTRSSDTFHRDSPQRAFVALRLLAIYHKLATIQTDTVFTALGSELVYDSYDTEFHFIVTQSHALLRLMGPGTFAPRAAHGPHNDAAAFLDVAWLPACYFVALHCRTRRIRHAACKILAASEHRESAWDARVVAMVGRRVVQIEEERFYGDAGLDEDLADFSDEFNMEQEQDRLPQKYRVRHVEFIRPEGLTAKVVLSYLMLSDDERGWQLCVERGDLRAGEWVNEGVIEHDLPVRKHVLLPKVTTTKDL